LQRKQETETVLLDPNGERKDEGHRFHARQQLVKAHRWRVAVKNSAGLDWHHLDGLGRSTGLRRKNPGTARAI